MAKVRNWCQVPRMCEKHPLQQYVSKVQDNKQRVNSSQMLPSALSYRRRERALGLRTVQSRGRSRGLIPKPKFIPVSPWPCFNTIPFNTIPHIVVIPHHHHKIVSLLFHNYSFATVVNCNVNI